MHRIKIGDGYIWLLLMAFWLTLICIGDDWQSVSRLVESTVEWFRRVMV